MGKDLHGNELGKGISQRKDGRYEARAVVNGVKIDIYNLDLKILQKEFELEKGRALLGDKYTAEKSKSLTLKIWYDEWFENYKSPTLKNESSKKIYYRKVNNTYVDILGCKAINKITQMDIQMATNELFDNNYSIKTVKEAYGALRDCYEIAIANSFAFVNPCVGVYFKESYDKPKERRVLTHEEQKIFLEEVKNSYYEPVYKILLLTGMRIGELGGLWWSDIDWKNKCININRSLSTSYLDGVKTEMLTTPKTANSYRSIPFFSETEQLLLQWQEKQKELKRILGKRWRADESYGDLVFTSSLGSPITRYLIVHDIKKVTDNINQKESIRAKLNNREPILFKHLHPHAFRHTFATRCFEKGLDPLFVQEIMGHSNYSTTLSYTHLLDKKKREEMARVQGNFLDLD